MTELVKELRPVLTDYAYDKRRREDRHRALTDWRLWLAFVGGGLVGAVLLTESIVSLWRAFA